MENKNKDTLRTVVYSEKNVGQNQSRVVTSDWKSLQDDPIYQSMLKNMGIGNIHPMYIEVTENQNLEEEYAKIVRFLRTFIFYYAEKYNADSREINIQFINYGKTELVYVLTEKSGHRVTLLVKQPAVELGKVQQEVENLKQLRKYDEKVVAPIDYFSVEGQELYMTPYINQARCIASDRYWGMYIPEPYYRFENFTEQQAKVVTTCMIAKLVSFFDFKNNEGIKSCKLGGGDFMLPKGWELQVPTIENTLDNLYFIAAREKIHCSFEEYLNFIRKEFSRRTINEPQENLVINLRGRVAISPEDIESGIKLGQQLIDNRNNKVLNKKLNIDNTNN